MPVGRYLDGGEGGSRRAVERRRLQKIGMHQALVASQSSIRIILKQICYAVNESDRNGCVKEAIEILWLHLRV